MGEISRTWTQWRRTNLTKISKQHWEIKLEMFPPECREKGGYNYKVEDVLQKKVTQITLLQGRNQKNDIRSNSQSYNQQKLLLK